jgi:N utilization substance protein B
MLNRRTLRIKVMQSLFAFEQCSDANYELAKEWLVEKFSPDLNSMEFQDKPLLKARQQAALKLLDVLHAGGSSADVEEEVATAAGEAIATYERRVKADLDFLKKRTVDEIVELTAVYHSVLTLITALAAVARTDKRGGHEAFTENTIVKFLTEEVNIQRLSRLPNSGWDTRMDIVRGWFRDVIRPDETYQQYVSVAAHTPEEEMTFVRQLVRKLVLGETLIAAWFEDRHIRWSEDREIVRGLVEKTLKTTRIPEGFRLQELSVDWEDDRAFVEIILEKAARLPSHLKNLIAQNTVNWSVERLPLTDRIIIQMAIAEFISQPNVPVKVTINEYIELAKEYSTPKSRQFINGILDVLSKELRKSGELKKSGRGLIDNK